MRCCGALISVSRCAVIRRTAVSGTRSSSSCAALTGPLVSAVDGGWVGSGSPGAVTDAAAMASSTPARTMRPPRPLPTMPARPMSFLRASDLASGRCVPAARLAVPTMPRPEHDRLAPTVPMPASAVWVCQRPVQCWAPGRCWRPRVHQPSSPRGCAVRCFTATIEGRGVTAACPPARRDPDSAREAVGTPQSNCRD